MYDQRPIEVLLSYVTAALIGAAVTVGIQYYVKVKLRRVSEQPS